MTLHPADLYSPGRGITLVVRVDARWVQTGTTEPYPKYGLYAAYSDHNNYVVAYIDRINNVYATNAVISGTAQGWQNTSLPAGFDPAQYHTIKVVKAGDLFTFYLDTSQEQQRNVSVTGGHLINGQPGLVTDDTQASYQNFQVSNVS